MRKIPVFYNKNMVAKDNPSRSPSAEKPEHVVANWLRQPDISEHIEIHEDFAPASAADLGIAHHPLFVQRVMELKEDNGFRNADPNVLSAILNTNGSFLAAVDHVMKSPDHKVAASPSSGFHHAGYDQNGGFCTFNALAVAAIKYSKMGFKVGILDLDQHYGDGTNSCFDRKIQRIERNLQDKYIYTYSLYPNIVHYTAGALEMESGESSWFLNEELPSMLHTSSMAQVDVLLYQAGADSNVNDPLGGYLTTEQQHKRDEMVFNFCASTGKKVVWNLAGGYQIHSNGKTNWEALCEIHSNTMRACVKAFNSNG